MLFVVADDTNNDTPVTPRLIANLDCVDFNDLQMRINTTPLDHG